MFDQEQAETLWLGRRDRSETIYRDAAHLAPAAGRLSWLPAGHAQGYVDCFDVFGADAYAASARQPPAGLPLIGDGVRAARITYAVLASARTGTWTEVTP